MNILLRTFKSPLRKSLHSCEQGLVSSVTFASLVAVVSVVVVSGILILSVVELKTQIVGGPDGAKYRKTFL